MKVKLVLLFVLSLSAYAFGQASFRTASFTMSVKGSSNLHDWESQVNEVRATGSMSVDAGALQSIQALTVEIVSKSIKSAKGSIMDKKTYDALKADKFPTITFKLEKATVAKKGDSYDVSATGSLMIAGATNKVDLAVRGKVGSDGSITFTGSKKLKMTDYKIKPPTALLGTMTVGDEVEIVFKLTLKP
ncbi:MAG: YceI family protein [Saprospirales bacterium]|nr:YceI family protein [Saprospirales bacterium]MBK8920135.1 YceI family protein [Saprospirales bacterium]